MFAAVVATLGDLGELWTVNAGRAELALSAPPEWLIVPATLAGALRIPLYALGYFGRARSLVSAAPLRARVVIVGGAVFSVLGAIVHTVTGVLIQGRVGGIASGLDPLAGILASGPIALTLWGLALAAFLVVSAAEASLPQRAGARLANPLLLTVGLTIAASLLPASLRDIASPAALNVAHVLFFASVAARGRGATALHGARRMHP